MSNKIITDIVSVLNDEDTLEKKRINIYALCKNKRKRQIGRR